MFRKIGDGLRRFMAGRYGSDRLNQCLLGAAFVLILISAIGGRQVQWMSMLSLLAYVPLIWSMFRMYSRNIEARRRENAAFLRFFSRLTDKQYRYFRCPGCRAARARSTSAARNAAVSSSKRPDLEIYLAFPIRACYNMPARSGIEVAITALTRNRNRFVERSTRKSLDLCRFSRVRKRKNL